MLSIVALGSLVAPSAGAQEASCTVGEGWAVMRADWAGEVLTLTNAHRATLGLEPLAVSDTLAKAAGWKAAHMAYYDYFSHDDPHSPTRTWDQRIRDCGYTSGAGENIAYGYRGPAEVVEGWLNSPGHKRNIENPDYRAIGVGAAVDANGRPYWVQNFGTKADSAVTAPLPTQPTTEPTTAPEPEPTTAPEPEPTATTEPTDGDANATPTTYAPTSSPDSVTVSEDQAVRLDPLANDSLHGNEVEIIYHEDPAHGRVIEGEDGTLLYRPDADFSGQDTFHYWISDKFDRTCGSQVTVTVEPTNDAPVARLDRVTVRPRSTVFVRVLSNDVDVDGDRVAFETLQRRPKFGSATVDTDDGVIAYRARRGAAGRYETITYVVGDGNGGTTVGTLRIRIRR